MIGVYKPLLPSTLSLPQEESSDETKAWEAAVGPSKTLKEMSAITGLDVQPVTGNLLVTSSKVVVYDDLLDGKRSYYSESASTKYGGVFRKSDGRLFCVGSQTGRISIYDYFLPKPLREVGEDNRTRHTAAVRRALFHGQHNVISVSDDKTIKVWDLADGSLVSTFGGKKEAQFVHDNYIRASCFMDGFKDDLFLSGSYDQTVKVWDAKNPVAPVSSFSTPGPVESIVSKNNLIIASAGRSILVYDMLANKVLTTMNNIHSKTITSLGVIRNYFVSCALDGFLKVYSASTFNEVIKYKHPGSELTRLTVNDKSLIVGSMEAEVTFRPIKSRILETFEAGGDTDVVTQQESVEQSLNVDVYVQRKSKGKDHIPKLKPYDKELKKFNHSKALDLAFDQGVDPCETVSLMQELIRRDALNVAISGRSGLSLDMVFNFINRNLTDVRFHRTLLDVASKIIEIYSPQINSSHQVRQHLKKMNKIMNQETKVMIQMKQLTGQLEMIQGCLNEDKKT